MLLFPSRRGNDFGQPIIPSQLVKGLCLVFIVIVSCSNGCIHFLSNSVFIILVIINNINIINNIIFDIQNKNFHIFPGKGSAHNS